MNKFEKGDKVRLVHPELHVDSFWAEELTVDEPTLFKPRVGVEILDSYGYTYKGAFFPGELELVKPELPKYTDFCNSSLPDEDIRIVINGNIGNKVYKTVAEARDEARELGKNGEEFDIVSIIKLGSYKVETYVVEQSPCF